MLDAKLINMVEAGELTLSAIGFWIERLELRADATSRKRKLAKVR